ncbi:hypothetical protein GP486_006215 [Trichoglossum hirsutum]|uniref:DUF7514 domain-containing protein n=1 Tax=Trichoglossum hirsutum TaxID=265104 RepID=A0A9P8L5R6_9PEZI|nr:hypothetical protein GP486_006215 [Trichoglossum hirsutum]
MAYDGYRSPRADYGFSSDHPFAGTRPGDPRASLAYPSSDYQPQISTQYVNPRDHRDSRDYSRSPAAGNGYPSDPTRDPAHQSRYSEYSSPASERPDPVGAGIPPELYAQMKADVKAELMKELKASGGLAADSTVPLARTQSAQSTYAPPRPVYSTYGPAPNTPGYFNPIPQSPRDQGLRPDDKGPPSPAASSDSGPMRPRPSRASTSGGEPTALDRTWGKLFDSNGNPTSRLGELLRGLANHIIADFEPRNSIVVTPSKMARYYEVVKIADEPFLWSYQFTGRNHASLSRLYRDLECQHHLIQSRYDEPPYIPGLTPAGFEKWMTTLLKAYPDQEVGRLQKAIREMPINNAENPRERFPKEINRQLFPMVADMRERVKFERASSADDDQEEPKPVKYESQGHHRSESAHPLERERAPYFGTQEPAVEDMPSARNIERERKPYGGRPGIGKTYDTSTKLDGDGKPMRANSTSKVRPPNIIPPPQHQHHRTGSSVGSGSALPPRRKRSPSTQFRDSYRHSESDISTTYEGGVSLNYDDERYAREAEAKRGDWVRRAAEEEAREFEGPTDRVKYDKYDKYDKFSRDAVVDDRDVEDLRGRFDREEFGQGLGYDEDEDYYRRRGGKGKGGTTGTYAYDLPYSNYRV